VIPDGVMAIARRSSLNVMQSTERQWPSFARSRNDRVITGVAGGLAGALGVEAWIVRAGFFLMSLGGGIGIIAYLGAYALSTEPTVEPATTRPITSRHSIGFVLVSLGVLVFAQTLGIAFPRQLVIPLSFLVLGSIVMWTRLGETERARLARDPMSILASGHQRLWRLIIGAPLLIAGVIVFLASSNAFHATRSVLLAVFATIIGVSLLLGPWLIGLAREVSDERLERIRNEERAEMSAHLHDSVLNTLALIQRSDAPSDVVTLARRQERELRAWMQGRSVHDDSQLSAVLDNMVSMVEANHSVSVDAVVVGGDPAIDERISAFVAAIQEATTNAARHSGADRVDVYVEVEPKQLTAYVRDQGAGFDRSTVPEDRRGIADSIEGRLRRIGGTATIQTGPGEGTEVELRLPKEPS
jgi:signal transduction histidine kinase/phage shock protein PspC (stress-responsive transcriptional regulator)